MKPGYGLFVLFGFMVASDYAFAWAQEGHEVIGSIAGHLISRHARSKIAQILGFELRVAATWADCVKNVKRHDDGTFAYEHEAAHKIPRTPFEALLEKKRTEDYVRRNWDNCAYAIGYGCHEAYHFADVAI
jgi:S1/P1 Nuclease